MSQYLPSWSTISESFSVPGFLEPWLDRFFEPLELKLIQILSSGPLSPDKLSNHDLERAYKRGIVGFNQNGQIELADFHTRFEVWAIFEGWKDIPTNIQERLAEWELDYYESRNQEMLEVLKRDNALEVGQKNSEYLLLHEAEKLLERAEHIYLWPCNCRAMMGHCSQSLYTCLRFDNDRGLGWEISHQRAKEITRKAHQKGLMQLGEIFVTADRSLEGGLCNCCADCCFPHLMAERLNSQKIWPKSRYFVYYATEKCISCAVCVKRCPFQAFRREDRGKERKIVFDVERCRGCGVCVTSCPADAIEMRSLEM